MVFEEPKTEIDKTYRYAHRLHNRSKLDLCRKYYGRYMDDTYIIHPNKDFLKTLLKEIEEICGRLGIVINKKKTQIIKLSQGFTFLKIRYIYGEHGKIIKIPCRNSITRERRKLKKLKNFSLAGRITPEEICEQYKSWRGNLIKYNAYKSVRSTDALYKSLFWGQKWENPKKRKSTVKESKAK